MPAFHAAWPGEIVLLELWRAGEVQNISNGLLSWTRFSIEMSSVGLLCYVWVDATFTAPNHSFIAEKYYDFINSRIGQMHQHSTCRVGLEQEIE